MTTISDHIERLATYQALVFDLFERALDTAAGLPESEIRAIADDAMDAATAGDLGRLRAIAEPSERYC